MEDGGGGEVEIPEHGEITSNFFPFLPGTDFSLQSGKVSDMKYGM